MTQVNSNKYERNIILLASHFVNEVVVERFEKLRSELSANKYDVALLLNMDEQLCKIDYPNAVYSNEQLNKLGYNPICETVLPGSCHFPVLAFYKEHPEYRHYWFIEYDVVYTGCWSSMMDDFEDDTCDFVSCGIEKYNRDTNGSWPWWTLHNDVGYPLEQCVKGFNPICRYSNNALHFLDKYQRKGYSAHSEVLITTSLYNAGFTLSDFGGVGEFTHPSRKSKHYIPDNGSNNGSVRWRPEWNTDDNLVADKLYHPIKTLQ